MGRRILLVGIAATLVVTFAGAAASVAGATATSPGLPHSLTQIRQALTRAGLRLGSGATLGELGGSTGGPNPDVVTPSQWSELPNPTFGAGQTQVLSDVSCATPASCVAVGWSTSGTVNRPVAAVLAGGAWTTTSVPAPTTAPNSSLDSVSCASPSFCVAVGIQTATPRPSGIVLTLFGSLAVPFFEQWNGSAWTLVPTPTPAEAFVSPVSCPTTSFCMALGLSITTTTSTTAATVVNRWNGSTWSVTQLPEPATIARVTLGVSCTSPTFCMAGGLRLDFASTPTTVTTFAMRWNGTGWATVPVPALGPTQLRLIRGLSCATPSVCTAVGYQEVTTGTGIGISAVIEQWNGSAWTLAPTPNGGNQAVLLGVDCFGPTSCVAAGAQASPTTRAVSVVDNWDGTTWSEAALPSVAHSPTATQGLLGVSCVPGVRCVAVGINPPNTLVLGSPVPRPGYNEVASDGGLFAFGGAPFYGSMGGQHLNEPIVGMAMSPDGGGYWEVASDGGIFAFGDAAFYGSMGGTPLNKPVVGMAVTPDGRGYYEVASDGGIFAFGDATFHGSMGGTPLNEPVVGMAVTPDGRGYWEVASDGGIFAFGDATFHGSMGGTPLNKPVVGMATMPSGNGYWEVASDGGIFSFGDAPFLGSMGGQPLNEPVVGIATTPSGSGYWEVASDGGIFSFGDAPFLGSMGGQPLNEPMVGMAQ